MMTSTFLDLGLSPAPTGMPGAPSMVAAGGIVPDFGKAMAELLSGTAPDALAKGVSTNRQDMAVAGKPLPPVGTGAPLVAADIPECVMPDPNLLPVPAPTGSTVAPDTASDPGDPDEPNLEPALAWLMPPVPMPAPPPPPTPVVPTSTATPASVTSPIVVAASPPTFVPSPTPAQPGTVPATPVATAPLAALPGIDCEMPVDPVVAETTPAAAPTRPGQPIVTAAPSFGPDEKPAAPATPPFAAPRKADAPLGTEAPASPVRPAVPTKSIAPIVLNAGPTRSAPEVRLPVAPLGTMPAPAQPGVTIEATAMTMAVPTTGDPARPEGSTALPGDVKTPAALWLQPRTSVSGTPVAGQPVIALPREPLAAIPEQQLRTAATQRVEIQPVPTPARDSGAMLAAAAAIRAAPAMTAALTDTPAGTSPTTSVLDIGQFAPIVAGAPAAAPVAAPQQAGIDLAHDHGLHRMIDRIEHLRDAFDARDTRIRLIPDALGPVDISVRRDAASDSVQVHFTAAEAGTRQLIADAQHRLVELADSRGVRIERATVDSGSANSGGQQTWSGGDQSRPHQQAQTAPQPRAPARATRDADPESTDKRIA